MECRHCRATGAGCLLQEEGGRNTNNPLEAILAAEATRWVEVLMADSWWAKIKDLGPQEQIKKIRSISTLQSLPVFEAILADSKAAALSDPFLGESLVRAALTVIDLLPESRHSRTLKNDLRGEAMTVIANCRRLAADFQGSAVAVEEARRCLGQGTGDPSLKAGLLSIHCSLCADLGDFENALGYVRHAVEIFQELEDWQAMAHNSILEAGCLFAAHRPAEALERACFALERTPPQETRLQVLALLIRVESLVLLNRHEEAFPDFMKARSLCAQADTATRLRVVYCEARLLDCLGSAREAEQLLRKTVKTYFDQELYKEAFITLLTLFECLCRRGALGKAAALCEEAIAATSQAGAACNEPIRQTWEELLAAVRVRQLSESELLQARQYLVRNWSVAAGTFKLQPLETAASYAVSPPEIPAPPPVPAADEPAPGSYKAAEEEYCRRLTAAALDQAGGNISEAGRLLGIARNTLKERMRRFGM
jgi:tetratricopeptide (TPR) repeat protein